VRGAVHNSWPTGHPGRPRPEVPVHARVTRVPLITLAIGTITILAAGCGGSGSATSAGGTEPAAAPLSPQQAIQLAAKHAKTLNSMTATFSIQITAASRGGGISGTVKEQLHPSLLLEADLSNITGTQSLPGELSEIVAPAAIYLRSPALAQAQHITKPWVEIPLAEMGVTGAALNQLLNQLQTASPLTETQFVSGSRDVRRVGTGVVDGVPVTEYAGSFTMSQALAALPASMRSAVESQVGHSGITGGTFKIWLDAQQDPRKVVVTETGGPITVNISEKVTSINQPVKIDLPPSAEIYVVPASRLRS
jgi:hypothetical protein